MSIVVVQKIRDANQSRPMLKETTDLLDQVRMRAFELFQKRGGVPGSDLGDWLQAEKEVFRVPDMELAESDGEFQLQFAMPGFEAKDIRIAALPDELIVEGEAAHRHRGADGTVRYCEFGERRVFRQIPLPKQVDVDRVSATLDKGLLQVRAAKTNRDRGKKAAA
ncbi:MAG: Hsp20 family protein [Bryobacteraceae bacterium]